MNNNWSFGIYLRISNISDNSNSINNQRLFISKFLEKNIDIDVYNTYIDEGYTGTNFDRPAFKALLEDIKLGKINGIIVKDLSRLGRNYISVGTYIDEFFPANNIRFISINDNIDTINLISDNLDITTSFKNVINELYVKDISDKVKATITYKKNSGKIISGNVPYGYMINPDNKYQLVIDKEVSNNIVLIFTLYLRGYGVNKIVKELNKRKIIPPSKYKKVKLNKDNIYWTNTTVYNILTNDVYCGFLNDLKKAHEAIISEKVFYKVNKILKEKNFYKEKHGNKYLFSGFIRCASCKAFMLIKKSNTANHEIYCSTYARINEELCSSHYITSRYLEEVVSIQINNKINELIFLKKELENIKRIITKKKYLDNSLAFKELLKIFIYNAKLVKMNCYEKWKLNRISYNIYLDIIKSLNKYILLIERLQKSLIATYTIIKNGIDEISSLKKLIKYKNKVLTREMLKLFVDVIYIEEGRKINVVYKNIDNVAKIKEFIEDFTSE